MLIHLIKRMTEDKEGGEEKKNPQTREKIQ